MGNYSTGLFSWQHLFCTCHILNNFQLNIARGQNYESTYVVYTSNTPFVYFHWNVVYLALIISNCSLSISFGFAIVFRNTGMLRRTHSFLVSWDSFLPSLARTAYWFTWANLNNKLQSVIVFHSKSFAGQLVHVLHSCLDWTVLIVS